MSEEGCGIDKVIECTKKAMELAQSFYKMTTGGDISNVRFEGFDTRNENVYTVDLSFLYPPTSKQSELDRLLKGSDRAYKRFSFDKKTLEMISFDEI